MPYIMVQLLQSRRITHREVLLKRGLVIAAVAVAIGAWLGIDPIKEQYHLWKQQRALKQAKGFIEKNDAADAQLALQVAFQAAPGNIGAFRIAADMLEQVGSRQSLDVRQEIVQMMSATVDDRVALVNSAIKFGDYNAAHDALSQMAPEDANKPPALAAALSFAVATENAPVADMLLDRLKAMTPDNEDLKFAQAALHLKHPDAAKRDDAHRYLEQIATNPKFSLRAHRQLMSDAMARRDYLQAKKWAGLLAADPGATFKDRLYKANFDELLDKRPFGDVFAELAPLAGATPSDAVDFSDWLLVQGKVAQADSWLGGLPPAVRDTSPVNSARAGTAAQLKDWDRLATMLEAGAWGPVPPEVIRLAMAAHLVGSRGSPTLQAQVWDQAIQAGQNSLLSLVALQRLAGVWLFEAESERTLWAITRVFPDQTWAHQALFNAYRAKGDAASMRDVMIVLRDAHPSVVRYKHDAALLTLLTQPASDWDPPKDVVQQLYQKDTANPFYATSYAFALAQAGKAPEALAVVTRMSQADRDYSPRSPYLAYVYGVNKDRGQVDRLQGLSLGTKFTKEEQALFIGARVELDKKPIPAHADSGMKPPPEP